MKRLAIILSGLFVLATGVKAQNEIDALRYSRIGIGGTSRFVSTGGAFGALGGDFSTLSYNPAGIGIYKTTEFTVSPGFFTGKTQSSFNGMNAEDMKYNLNLPNLGMVWSFGTGKDADAWKFFQFGFGLNRLANFNNRISIQGENHKTSLMDDYLIKAQGTSFNNYDAFDIGLAWDTYLLDTLNGVLFSPVPAGGILQRKDITTWGGMNEMVISFGGNYSDKFFIGGTIGIPYVSYYEESTYSETDVADTIISFKNFYLDESLKTTGSGINLKLGFIYRPVSFVRIGAAVHTPTFFTMHDEYSRKITSNWDDNTRYIANSPSGELHYSLTTPLRAIGSLAFILGNYGALSVDYEFVDYSEARLRNTNEATSSVTFADANNLIRQNYQAATNLRFGGELKLSPISLRAGYAMYDSPFKNNLNDGKVNYMSFGVGMREKNYFIDLAYVTSSSKENYYLYPSVGDAAVNTLKTSAITATLGVKF